MPIFETFAKRKREMARAGQPVIFQQDELPSQFRVQVAHIWTNLHGDPWSRVYRPWDDRVSPFWELAHRTVAAEMGRFALLSTDLSPYANCNNFLISSDQVDDVLSLIEIVFKFAEDSPHRAPPTILDEAVAELNQRFLEHRIGYQFQAGQIIGMESLYQHSEIVEPAITLMYDANFSGPLQEFMDAHKHYREGNFKDSITDAANAFESTLKAICDIREWPYDTRRATASTLIGVLFDNGLVPGELQSHFSPLRSVL